LIPFQIKKNAIKRKFNYPPNWGCGRRADFL
jgi:hypothetical protein